MAGSVRCPNCGGLNPAEAEWCGQCHQRFAARTPPPPPPPPPGIAAAGDQNVAAREGDQSIAAPGARAQVAVEKRGAFSVGEDGIKWTCSRCDTENALDASVCAVCGTTFADSVRPPKDRPQRDPNTTAMYSLFFPGAGHWHLGLKGAAVARGILSSWVVFVAIVAAVARSVVMAGIFGVAAFALWAIAAHDAYREARGEAASVILKSRTFVYVVIGLLMLMVIMLVATSFQVNR